MNDPARSLLVDHIGVLVTNDPTLGEGRAGERADAAIVIDDGLVAWVGDAGAAPATDDRLDVAGAAVIPGFVDSHAHLVFAGDRTADFVARMTGTPYTAGGIATTVAATRAASDEMLRAKAARLTRELLAAGCTTIEVKSGYGLTVEDEVRALQIAGEITDETTYLGAHVVPPEYRGDADGYVDLVTGPMLDACAPLARWIDVFIEEGAFGDDAARIILEAGADAGMGLRVHANQLGHSPGVRLACELGAASVDHCTFLDDADLAALADSGTVATLLPGVEFSTRMPYPDARRLLDASATVALATDCNPGTCFTTSMPFVIALAVRECGFTPTEAVTAATAGGATALQRNDVGHLGVGAAGDLVVLDAPHHAHLAYRPGVPLVRAVVRGGQVVVDRSRP